MKQSLLKQSGSTLLVALVVLVLMMLIAVSAINASSGSVMMVGNAQFHEESNAAGQQAIESVISSSAFQTTVPVDQNVDVNLDGVADYSVKFEPAPSCLYYKPTDPTDAAVPKECYGSVGPLCYWTVWEVTAVVSDLHGSGAATVVHQGVRTIAGLKAAKNACGA